MTVPNPQQAPEQLRNRIVGNGELLVEEAMYNPENWRIHPMAQQEALTAVLQGIGWVQQVLVNRVTGHLIDGHLRVQVADRLGEQSVPCLYVDLSPDEELVMLASLDPLSAMAVPDTAKLDEMLAGLRSRAPELLEPLRLVTFLARDGERIVAPPPGSETELPPDALPASEPPKRASLAERFGVPPFSVLDARQGYWQERKRAWLALGIQSELGRGENLQPTGENSVYSGDSDWAGVKGPRLNASPGGAPRPAAKLGPDGHTQRGDSHGRPLYQSEGYQSSSGNDGQAFRVHRQGQAPPDAAFGTGGPDNWSAQRAEWREAEREGRKPNGLLGYSEQARTHYRGRPPHGASVTQNPDGSLNYQPTNQGEGQSGTSVFDPVLTELAYRWFCPSGGRILDPFAGGSVRGIVAGRLGYQYVGIDLRPEQVEANAGQLAAIPCDPEPMWVVGDSRDLGLLLPEEERFDLVFSCPPYFDLEQYSGDPADLSNAADYAAFMEAYRAIIAAAATRLRPERFLVLVVGEIRDKKGLYRGFVPDTIAACTDAGLSFYNEGILVTAVGSLPIRVGAQFGRYRKLGKTHQNVLAFYNGDPQRIPEQLGEVSFIEPADQADAEPPPGDELEDGNAPETRVDEPQAAPAPSGRIIGGEIDL